MEENTDIIEQCNEFLRKSSKRYSTTLKRAADDLQSYSGSFWSDNMKKDYRSGKNRLCLALNNWNVMCNAIASPMSASPWHTELKNQSAPELKQIQEQIDEIEQRNDVKTSIQDSFRKAVLTGYGFLVVSVDADEFTGEPTIVVESVKHPQTVALDPAIMTVDGSDAEEGAIVNFIGIRKAKRLYGDDVVPMNYPASQGLLSTVGLSQWTCPVDQVALVSYYVKEDAGVHYYQICGNKVVKEAVLPIKAIPIIRIAGNEIFENEQVNYNGIIQQTMSLELGANIAYSTLIERCGRSVKANYIINVDAIDGLENYYAQASDEDSAVVLWKGEHEPVPITEQFATGDLQATVTTCRTLMEDVTGVPLTGIPESAPEKTATEILRQQTSKESNTANYYNNAFTSCRTLSKIFIEMLTGGTDLQFTLENGPSVVTRQMKARQELSALSAVCPEEMKGILAVYFARTLEDDVGEDISRNMVANLPPNIQFLEQNSEADPVALHQLSQMKQTLDMAMGQLDEVSVQNQELQKQLDAANLSLMEGREERILKWNIEQMKEQDRMALETAKLQQSGAVDAGKLQLDAAKVMQQAENDQIKAMNESDKLLFDLQHRADEAEKRGYEQGIRDMAPRGEG